MTDFDVFNASPQYCSICHLPHQSGIYVIEPEGDAVIHAICPRCAAAIGILAVRLPYLETTPEEWGWYAEWLEEQKSIKRYSEVGAAINHELASIDHELARARRRAR